MKTLISAWFLKDLKIGTSPLDQASNDLNQVRARMTSFIAFSMCLLREGMWNMYIQRERPPTTTASPSPTHGRLVNVCQLFVRLTVGIIFPVCQTTSSKRKYFTLARFNNNYNDTLYLQSTLSLKYFFKHYFIGQLIGCDTKPHRREEWSGSNGRVEAVASSSLGPPHPHASSCY